MRKRFGRYWFGNPGHLWMALRVGGGLLLAAVVLSVAGLHGLELEQPWRLVLAGAAVVSLAGTVACVAYIRRRTIVDERGVKVVRAWSSQRVGWTEIRGLAMGQDDGRWVLWADVAGGELVLFTYQLRGYGDDGPILGSSGSVDSAVLPDWAAPPFRSACAVIEHHWRGHVGPHARITARQPASPTVDAQAPLPVSASPPVERRLLRDRRFVSEVALWTTGMVLLFPVYMVIKWSRRDSPITWTWFLSLVAVFTAIMVAYFVARTREGTIVTSRGITLVRSLGFSRQRLPWSRIHGLELEHAWGQWLIQARTETGPTTVYHRRPGVEIPIGELILIQPRFRAHPNGSYPRPTDGTPMPVREAFALLHDYWHHHRHR
ncbi:hypothetical protein [Stackebrandtia nassauensis]|nr:hypothetical protein [Stackebrandtia nassauensis]